MPWLLQRVQQQLQDKSCGWHPLFDSQLDCYLSLLLVTTQPRAVQSTWWLKLSWQYICYSNLTDHSLWLVACPELHASHGLPAKAPQDDWLVWGTKTF
jgi:hypothetical protein